MPTFRTPPPVPLDPEAEAQRLAEVTGKYYVKMLAAANEALIAAVPPLSSWEVSDEAIAKVLASARIGAVRMTNVTLSVIRNELADGYRNGESIDELAARIDGLYTEHWKSRSQTIARTELGTAALKGCQDRYLESGVVAEQEILDGDYDPECAARNGKRVPVTEVVELNHPNCVAAVAPVLKPEEDYKLPVQDMGLQYKPDESDMTRVLSNVDALVQRAAQSSGYDTATIRKKCTDALKGWIDANPISIRRKVNGSLGLMKDGRMKTQFETHTSSGALDNKYRAAAEKNGLGYPKKCDPVERPVYGYIATPSCSAQHYGSVEWRLNEAVKKRATFSYGDSLGQFDGSDCAGSPLLHPEQEQGWDTAVDRLRRGDDPYNYLEVQVQRGVHLSDVDSVVFHAGCFGRGGKLTAEYQRVYDAAVKKGLKVELDESTD